VGEVEKAEQRVRDALRGGDESEVFSPAKTLLRISPERATAIANELCRESGDLSRPKFRYLMECISVAPCARDIALKILRGPESPDRVVAAVALAYLPSPEIEAFPELIKLYESDPELTIVARALPMFKCKSDAYFPIFERVLISGSEFARWLAADAVRFCENPTSSLIRGLEIAFRKGGSFSDEVSDSVRFKVLFVLRAIGMDSIGTRLFDELAKSDSGEDREEAQKLARYVDL
jgi:hypothetical protein